MEFSENWGFLKILSETMKIYVKNVKLIASITTLSLLLSSLLFLLFSFAYQSAATYMFNSISDESGGILILFFALVLVVAVQLTFIFSCVALANATGVATIITTAASYTDTKLSLQDLFSAVKTKRKTLFRYTYNLGMSAKALYFLCFVAVVAVYFVIFYPNPATIAVVSAGWVAIYVYNLYASVGRPVAAVIAVVEDGCEAAEAAEKAEKLVEGQRGDGFMMLLFINIVAVIVCVGLWMIVGDRWRFNLTVYGLLFINFGLVLGIFVRVACTVYYFRCKEYHGEDSISTKLIGDNIL